MKIDVELDTSGLDELTKALEKASAANGMEIPIEELLIPDFIKANTPFKDLDDLLIAAGFHPDTVDEAALESDEFAEFLRGRTQFSSFSEMTEKALGQWAFGSAATD
jgi:hypothetical protein